MSNLNIEPQYQFNSITNFIINKSYNDNLKTINKLNFSNIEFRNLSLNMGEIAKTTDDINLKKEFNELFRSVIEQCATVHNPELETQLVEYCNNNNDIMHLYTNDNEFILVIDDITTEKVFVHNDYCFSLAEKFNDIENFMVIDEEEAEGSHDLLQDFKLIYQRGNEFAKL